jgi:hypothetical protein
MGVGEPAKHCAPPERATIVENGLQTSRSSGAKHNRNRNCIKRVSSVTLTIPHFQR